MPRQSNFAALGKSRYTPRAVLLRVVAVTVTITVTA